MSQKRTALLGFSIPAMEALENYGRPFVAVVPPAFGPYMEEHNLDYVAWEFETHNEQSGKLAEKLSAKGVEVAVPLYEETVEWAGALNGHFRDDPRLFTRYLLFRDKAMMKRRAQFHGIRVGVFEEVDSREAVERFFQRVNKAMSKLDSDQQDPIHMKPINAAGAYGHRFIRKMADIAPLNDDDFPALVETHLDGQEFSCEVFIHNGKIRFLNITEYVRLGHTNFVPASDTLNEYRPAITKAVQDLIDAFNIEYGMIHPEFFVTPEGKVSFGEVAARVPGGHIFELIERAYHFSPFTAFALCADPQTTEEELTEFFPGEDEHDGYAGCVMVYPKQRVVTRVNVPDELLEDEYYEKHNLFVPANPKVADREAFGDHYGTVYFHGKDSERMRALVEKWDGADLYASDGPGSTSSSGNGVGEQEAAANATPPDHLEDTATAESSTP